MRWKVYYRDQHDDLQKCWTEAANKEDAKDYVKSEYWDCVRIVSVERLD